MNNNNIIHIFIYLCFFKKKKHLTSAKTPFSLRHRKPCHSGILSFHVVRVGGWLGGWVVDDSVCQILYIQTAHKCKVCGKVWNFFIVQKFRASSDSLPESPWIVDAVDFSASTVLFFILLTFNIWYTCCTVYYLAAKVKYQTDIALYIMHKFLCIISF